METKQAQANYFTDGLNTDLHPLTTPNTVLTDCINGTIITYNGNEFILQNDMGNYKLKKAQLPPDYIPVGIKEYGSVIYIVSYNPIDKKCQIGSYPSPQTLFDNTDRSSKNDFYHGIQINPLDPDWVWDDIALNVNSPKRDTDGKIIYVGEGDNKHIEYTSITDVLFTNYSPKQNITILFPEKGDINDTFLNPGDKYWLYIEPDKEGDKLPASTKNTWIFQKINYCILTDTKEVYEVNNVEEKDSPYVIDGNMSSVTWETPGWLGYKPSLLNLESFNIYLTDIKLPAFIDAKNKANGGTLFFNIQGQATVNTNVDWTENFDHLKVLFEIKTDDKSYTILGRADFSSRDNYGNKIDVITYNLEKQKYLILKGDKAVTIRATPYLISDITDKKTLGIVYDNFRVEYQINLNDLYTANKIKVFEIYKYLVGIDDITINFSIVSPSINISSLICKYKLHSINDNFNSTCEITSYNEIPSINLLGQNILNIRFDTKFKKEEIYLFEVAFFTKDDTGSENLIFKTAQFLVTSEVFNKFYSSKKTFQDISLTEWTNKISDFIITDGTITLNDATPNKVIHKSYSYYSNVFNDADLFDKKFYDDIDSGKNNNIISEITDELDDYITASEKAMNKDISTSKSSGCFSSSISKLSYNIAIPIILNNKGIWADTSWKGLVKSTTTNTRNDQSVSQQNKDQIYNISKDTPNEYENISTIYTNSILSNFYANSYSGQKGEKWYLYKNLSIVLDQAYNGVWKTSDILSYNWKEWKEYPKKSTINRLTIIDSRLLVNSGVKRTAYQALAISSKNSHFKMIYNIKKLDTFDFINLDYIFNWTDLSEYIEDVDGTAEKFDNTIANSNSPLAFVSILPSSGNTDPAESYYKRGWNFADEASIEAYGSYTLASSGIAIQCKDGSKKSAAVIKFFPEQFNTDFRGLLRTTGDGDLLTTWLVSTTAKTQKHIIKNLVPTENTVEQFMNWCVGALMYGLGIHLYGYINLERASQFITTYTGQTNKVSSNNIFNNTFIRTDKLETITYKNININNLPKETLNNIFTNIGVDSEYYSICNLTGNVANVVSSNKKLQTEYIDKTLLKNIDTKQADFINLLSNTLKVKISDIDKSNNYSLNKVYTDYNKDNRISMNINKIAESMLFEYKNNTGYFYYSGLPDVMLHPISGGRVQDGCIRGLDWSSLITWDEVYLLLTPNSEFIKNENLE